MLQPELVLDAKATLGEGPCWLDESNRLLWVDIDGETVNLFDPATGENKPRHIGQRVGAAVQRENGGLLLALERGFYFYDLNTNDLTPLGDPEAGIATNRFNDGKCDPAGRFWAGTMALDKEPGNANLYRLNRDHSIEHVLSGVTTSNGLAWDRERAVMYYIDTKTKKVQAYDYEEASGAIANPRTAVTIVDRAGSPDGMTIDQEGMLWIALFRGWRVIRVNPATGERLAEIAVPASQVTSCAFGGSRLDELYITTARTGLSEEALKEQPYAGGIFCVKPGVEGAPSYMFHG